MTLRERLAGKRVGVVLSAGYFGFFGHAGFVQALQHANLAATAWAGTSAGGLIAAYAAAGLDGEKLEHTLRTIRRDDFWDPAPLSIVKGLISSGHGATGLLAGAKFSALLRRTLPIARFEQLRTPLLIVATELTGQRALNLSSGDLPSAIHATCAYPGLFQVVPRDGALLWDGGIVDKAPALALADHLAGQLDALLVHYLPSREDPKRDDKLTYPEGMAAGLAAIRKEHFRLQLQVLAARELPTYVVTNQLPPVSAKTLDQGPAALEAARRMTLTALDQPPTEWKPEAR